MFKMNDMTRWRLNVVIALFACVSSFYNLYDILTDTSEQDIKVLKEANESNTLNIVDEFAEIEYRLSVLEKREENLCTL